MDPTVNLGALRGQPVIVGATIAGLLTALHMGDTPCVLVSGVPQPAVGVLPAGLTALLEGGGTGMVRAAHTLEAGAGLARLDAVQCITSRMKHALTGLEQLGILSALAGCVSGAGLHAALLSVLAKRRNITIIRSAMLRRLVLVEGYVRGAVIQAAGKIVVLDTNTVIAAGGGACGLYDERLVPGGSVGTQMAVAARAGAVLSDLEFVQFHPFVLAGGASQGTALAIPLDLCGSSPVVDEHGKNVVEPGQTRALATVEVSLWRAAGHAVFLDLRNALSGLPDVTGHEIDHFVQLCESQGLDPRREALPVKSAAAFHIGGIKTDLSGRTSVAGLWACGEVACTGFHGASVLTGNPLLEAIVCSEIVARNVLETTQETGTLDVSSLTPGLSLAEGMMSMVRPLVDTALGPVREGNPLRQTLFRLSRFAGYDDVALIAQMMALQAYEREESRGVHCRADFPEVGAQARHSEIREKTVPATVRSIAQETHDINALNDRYQTIPLMN
ncbi:FAD-binding protein [Acetobacter conturbans]|uniref:L-aspartate oxidase n=1 Tax=Acetobacter conturbans TaxID=1737472 RepID=A0ABX0K080_9PROT|nr:FAD-binding protein [Acetobacter conturbans]NHN88221.1 FAD-binding protein [Acetobacter conturbans]